MDRVVYTSGGSGKITIPSSKSDVHRILIAASLAEINTEVMIHGISKDIEATMGVLRQLGSTIEEKDNDVWEVTPIWNNVPKMADLHCEESGSTLRFLLPVAAAVLGQFKVTGEGRLPERPITELQTQMAEHGCKFTADKLPFKVSGKLTSGCFTLPGNISSQYITGLMYALPLLDGDSEIKLTSTLESRGYVNMTIKTLRDFGICIEEVASGYHISGNQKFLSPRRIEAEGDWSNAAFFLALGALGGPITCFGLKEDTKQGDMEIIKILERFGAVVSREMGLTITKNNLQGIAIDASEIPDLVPILAVVAAVAAGETKIYNAERLRIKESNRLEAVCDGLTRMGVSITETSDGLLIKGDKLRDIDNIVIASYGDHRIVMAMSVAAVALERKIVIKGTQAVEKSYPTFYEDWERIGGRADVI